MGTALLVDLYELTMAEGYFTYKRHTCATFDLFVRQLPEKRGYLVACGLEDILSYIKNLKFDDEDIAYLKKQKIFSGDFLKFLKVFRFRGDIWAMPEGEVFFANQPVLRVTAPLIDAQLIESYLLNTINLQTMIAAKASRVVTAASGRKVYDFSLRRTHGPQAGLKVARASYISGASGTSNVLAAKLYHIPCVGTMAHSFVMSFRQEIDSFLAYAETFPDKTTLLVDTYDIKKGVANAINTGLYLAEKGYRLQAIRLDSADIAGLSKLARRMLDKAGLKEVKILASGNLDEFKISRLLKKGAKVDSFGVGTNMGTSIDAPCLDVIYKLSEVTDEEGRFLPVMKLSKGKVTYPGRKQVFRVRDKKGRCLKDILALEKEKIKGGRPLLIKVVEGGRVIYRVPDIEKTRVALARKFKDFSPRLLDLNARYRYPALVSKGLSRMRRCLTQQLIKRQ